MHSKHPAFMHHSLRAHAEPNVTERLMQAMPAVGVAAPLRSRPPVRRRHACLYRAAYPNRQCPPAGGRNGSRKAMCSAHNHAVPQTRTEEHDHSISGIHYGRCKHCAKMTTSLSAFASRGSIPCMQKQSRPFKLQPCGDLQRSSWH